MRKAKSAILVPTDLKNKKIDLIAKYLRRWVHVYQFDEEGLVYEAQELRKFYDEVIIVMKIK